MRKTPTKLLMTALFCLILIFVGGQTLKDTKYQGLFHNVVYGPPNDLQINVDSFAVPNTNPKAQPDFDIFAWNSFIALSWPAIIPDSTNGFLRGIPNTNASFANAKNNDLLVWETFKEKREIFNQSYMVDSSGVLVTRDTLFPWNYEVDYGELNPSDIDTNSTSPVTNPTGTRIFHQGKKQMTPFNAFDETTEVGSEVLEDTLYGGVPNPILHRPVGPRVWKGAPLDDNPVLYEVKLNYDYYDYVSTNKLWTSDTARINSLARSASLRLPYRTSAATGPKGQVAGSNYEIVTNYSRAATQDTFIKINQTLTADHPPRMGAMQFKVAWIKLDPMKDTLENYHIAEALYYVSDSLGNPVAREGLFGLIGIHIIQRIHINSNNDKPDPAGGTFIFATWEHTSIRNNAIPKEVTDPLTGETKTVKFTDFTYSNYYNPALDPGAKGTIIPGGIIYDNPQGFYPPINDSLPLDGVYPVPVVFDIIDNPNPQALGTVQVNQMVHDMLPDGSVWKNYQLVGTQFIAIDVNSTSLMQAAGHLPRYRVSVLDPQGIGLPVYLANLVIETNQGLQKFQGQPPLTFPILNYYGAGLTNDYTNNFQRDDTNTTFNRVAYNMGGCMGCHGVAQSKGFSFSFVLLGGRDGAKTDTETHFESPPLTPVR